MATLTRREVTLAGAALAAAAVTPLRARAGSQSASAPAVALDPMSLVDPELRESLQTMLKTFPPMELTADKIPEVRKSGPPFWGEPLAAPAVVEHTIPEAAGSPEVRVLVVGATSRDAPPRPAVLHIHGGGYIFGTAGQGTRALQQLALDHDCVVVSVDYRLAPETKFPGSLEDNYAALRWLHSHAEELGVDRRRIALKGESAGGGHAAALAIAARDRGEVPIALQVLIYPMLDDRTASSRAVPPHIGAFVWTPSWNRVGWSSLLGVPAGSDSVPRGSVPARVEDLSRLPPAFIGVGSIDLFVQEDIEYAQRLIEAGVPTELHVAPGGYHAFDALAPDAAVSRGFTSAWNAALSAAFRASTPAPAKTPGA